MGASFSTSKGSTTETDGNIFLHQCMESLGLMIQGPSYLPLLGRQLTFGEHCIYVVDLLHILTVVHTKGVRPGHPLPYGEDGKYVPSVGENIGSEIIGAIHVTNYFCRNNWFLVPIISKSRHQLFLMHKNVHLLRTEFLASVWQVSGNKPRLFDLSVTC